jgi:hypothetical protein
MSTLYRCPTCQSETTSDEMTPPRCVGCEVDMAPVGSADDESDDDTPEPIAPVNLAAYETGLAEIEKAKAKADADEREYVRAKEYAAKAKKRLETSEADLRVTIGSVADRLRPRPLLEAADHHTDDELVALLKGLNVDVTLEKVQGWTDAERADARAWALAAHSEQPRLIPPFLWAPSGESDDPEGPESETAQEYAERRQRELEVDHQVEHTVEDLRTAEPGDGDGHHYPEKKARKPRKRASEEAS